MKHFTVPSFWKCYEALPLSIRELADANYKILKENPQHPSLHFKKIQHFFSVRISLKYRALGIGVTDGIVWFWIGSHAEYDHLVG